MPKGALQQTGWYYLHTNGELIFKKTEPEKEEGGFVKEVWYIDTTDRKGAWNLCIKALALGARRSRVHELATIWGLNDEDAKQFVAREPKYVLEKIKHRWRATLKDFKNENESPYGYGITALLALSELIRDEAGRKIKAEARSGQ